MEQNVKQELTGEYGEDAILIPGAPTVEDNSIAHVETLESTLAHTSQMENLKALKDHLNQEWLDLRHSDAVIKCADGDVRCHRLILGSLSNMLRKAMRSIRHLEEETILLLAPEVKTETLKEFFSNAYAGGNESVTIHDSLRQFGFTESCLSWDASADLEDEVGIISAILIFLNICWVIIWQGKCSISIRN